MKITKRKDGRSIIMVPCVNELGVKGRKPLYGNTDAEVKQKYLSYMADYINDDICNAGNLTVGAYLTRWLKGCKELAETTRYSYKNYINNHIIKDIGEMKLKEIKPMHIKEFYNKEREKKFSEKTILQEHRILHKAFKEAVNNRLIPRNIIDMVTAPSPKKIEYNIYTVDNFKELLSKVQGTQDELIIMFAGLCGLRRGEIFGLRWRDIDTDKKTATIENTRTVINKDIIEKDTKNESSTRTVTLPDILNIKLKAARQHKDKLLFEDNPRNYSKHFKWIVEKTYKLKPTRFHDLRHFNATMLMEMDVDTKIISKRLGHSSTQITQNIYQHVSTDVDEIVTDKINKLFSVK